MSTNVFSVADVRTVSVATFAKLAGVPRSTVSGWLLRGVVPSIKIGGRRLIRLADATQALGGRAFPVEAPEEGRATKARR